MFDDTYRTLASVSEGLFKDKGSRFISYAYPVKQEEEIKAILQQIRKKHYDARHHCYAWALGPHRDAWRVNDDGEPSGTAGKPILGQILSHDLTNLLIIVVRYFGGTKLGVRGLIDAYKQATHEAIMANKTLSLYIKEVYELQFGYPLMNEVMRIIKEHELETLDTDFALSCKLSFQIRQSKADQIVKIFKNLHGLEITYKFTC